MISVSVMLSASQLAFLLDRDQGQCVPWKCFISFPTGENFLGSYQIQFAVWQQRKVEAWQVFKGPLKLQRSLRHRGVVGNERSHDAEILSITMTFT